MRRDLDLSTALVTAGAVAVLVSLFLTWYAPSLSAWDVFEVVDWALAALAAGALVVLAGETSGAAPPSQRLAWIAAIVLLLVAAEVIDPPPAAREATREVGAWLALGGAAVLALGATLAVARISVTIDVAGRERRRRATAVDARPAAAEEPPAPAARRRDLWARGGDESEGPPAGQAERGPDQERAGHDDATRPVRRAEAGAGEPAGDPDRTQPFSPVERPRDEGA